MTSFTPKFQLPLALDLITYAADKGVAYAQWLLGNLYFQGLEVAADHKKALSYYERAAQQKHNLALRDMAHFYLNGILVERDTLKGMEFLTAAAKQGDATAQLDLAEIYWTGKDGQLDLDRAQHWFDMSWLNRKFHSSAPAAMLRSNRVQRLANGVQEIALLELKAKSGDLSAMHAYGLARLTGYQRHSESKGLGLSWLKKACEGNYIPAIVDFAWYCLQENGCPELRSQALVYLTDNAYDDNKVIYNLLAYFHEYGIACLPNQETASYYYYRGRDCHHIMGRYLNFLYQYKNTMDPMKEHDIYEKLLNLSKKGFEISIAVLSKDCEDLRLSGSYERRKSHMIKLAEAGHELAMVDLAELILSERAHDKKIAYFWYHCAALEGSAYAMNILGFSLINGKHGITDTASATAYLQSAGYEGDYTAISKLAIEYMYNKELITNLSYVAILNEYAANEGSYTSAYNLAVQHQNGEGVDQDSEKSAYWFRKAEDLKAIGQYLSDPDDDFDPRFKNMGQLIQMYPQKKPSSD